jgi:hypothetical protein
MMHGQKNINKCIFINMLTQIIIIIIIAVYLLVNRISKQHFLMHRRGTYKAKTLFLN